MTRGDEEVTWVGSPSSCGPSSTFTPEHETPIDRLATWLARTDDDEFGDEGVGDDEGGLA